jgi:hypothetical protein
MSKVVELGQISNPQDADAAALLSAHNVYRWVDHGRFMYLHWWDQGVTSQAKEPKSDQDAIKQMYNSTWWDWADRSRPAHWK